MELLADGQPNVRFNAATGLARQGREEAMEVLLGNAGCRRTCKGVAEEEGPKAQDFKRAPDRDQWSPQLPGNWSMRSQIWNASESGAGSQAAASRWISPRTSHSNRLRGGSALPGGILAGTLATLASSRLRLSGHAVGASNSKVKRACSPTLLHPIPFVENRPWPPATKK